jgi:putative DNA primase/helicase
MVLHMGSTVFDAEEHCLARMTDMADACQFRHLGRQWKESPDRKIIRRENVGFDPTEKDPNIICNLWAGWPTQPKSGKCKLLLELLEYMCLEENNSRDIFEWILKWLAYPIQNPGAKMKSTIVIHGLQGTGKNLFFETIMAIYGRYGAVIDQNALEDKFTDWASAKLFLIADETIAKHELYHIKNRLKSIITGDWIRINLKNKEAYNERNHVNMVFLSNERMPVTLEADDRRHCVIWIPQKLGPEFYLEVAEEIRNGGREALHYYLLNEVDLTGFSEHTKPPMTEAKKDLIELSKDSINRFHDAWTAGEIDVGVMPTLTEDVYELYRTWCGRQGSKAAPLNKVIDLLAKNGKFHKTKKRYRESNGGMAANISNPRALLIPTSAQPPVDKGESDWLGDCVSAFRAALTDYKAGSVIKSEGF